MKVARPRPLRSLRRSFLPALILALLFLSFQNCGKKIFGGQSESPATRQNLGGDGYPGKVYANYGTCGDDTIVLKSAIQDTGSGLVLLRDECQDLPVPLPIAEPVRHGITDSSVFVYRDDIFDLVTPKESDRKITTAFCYVGDENDRQLDALVYFPGQSLSQDTTAARSLSGYVKLADGSGTGAPQAVFDDSANLALNDITTGWLYRTYNGTFPSSGPHFDLNVLRNQTGKVNFRDSSGVLRTVDESSLVCRTQVPPKYLSAGQSYLLKPMSTPIAAPSAIGSPEFSGYATIEFKPDPTSELSGTAYFRVIGSTKGASSRPTTQIGWNAGFVNIEGVVYEMRKRPDGVLCLAPSSSPGTSCAFEVIGKIEPDSVRNFQDFYTASFEKWYAIMKAHPAATAMTDTAASEAITRKSIQFRICPTGGYQLSDEGAATYAGLFQNMSWLIPYLSRVSANGEAAEVAAAMADMAREARALAATLPADLMQLPSQRCSSGNSPETLARIIIGLHAVYAATGDTELRARILALWPSLQNRLSALAADSNRFNGFIGVTYRASAVLELINLYDDLGAPVSTEVSRLRELVLAYLLDAQVLTDRQQCGTQYDLRYGGWTVLSERYCEQKAATISSIVEALVMHFDLYSRRGACAGNCARISESLRKALAWVVLNQNALGNVAETAAGSAPESERYFPEAQPAPAGADLSAARTECLTLRCGNAMPIYALGIRHLRQITGTSAYSIQVPGRAAAVSSAELFSLQAKHVEAIANKPLSYMWYARAAAFDQRMFEIVDSH